MWIAIAFLILGTNMQIRIHILSLPGAYPGFSKGGGEEPNAANREQQRGSGAAPRNFFAKLRGKPIGNYSPNFETVVSLKKTLSYN